MSKKLVFGVGINDVSGSTWSMCDGNKVRCPYYLRWTGMLKRCYSEKLQKKRPTYIGCTVCEEWLTFSNFKQWMEKQGWEGKHLDKDIIDSKNKTYCPEKCIFVSQAINNLFLDHRAARGCFPKGVSLHKNGRFQAKIKKGGKTCHIGHFNNEDDASRAYLKAKGRHVISTIKKQSDPRLRVALSRHVSEIIEEIDNLD